MSRSPRRRYQLRRDDLNERIDGLIEAAQRDGTATEDAELVRQLLTTGVHLLRDGTSRAELKLVNSALKELRHAFRVFAPHAETRKVAVFGSARTDPDHADWKNAHAFAEAIVRAGWMVITGAGDGIMGAAQGGAGRSWRAASPATATGRCAGPSCPVTCSVPWACWPWRRSWSMRIWPMLCCL